MKKKILIFCLILVSLASAEFLLPNYISRFAVRLKKDLGLIESKKHFEPAGPGESFQANEFYFTFKPIENVKTKRIAGLIKVDDERRYIAVQQDDLEFAEYNLSDFLEKSGINIQQQAQPILKQFLAVKDARFALLGLVHDGCIFATLIDLEKMATVDRYPCVDNGTEDVDFNNIGGGYVVRGENLYMSLGTTTSISSNNASFLAQDNNSPYGKVLKYNIVENTNGISLTERAIYTKGHRNLQGMAVVKGHIVAVEHGPKGGDEINIIQENKNYGWPLYSAGSRYNDDDLDAFAAKGLSITNPLFTFIPSIATSDISPCPSVISRRYTNMDCMIISGLRAKAFYIVLGDLENNRIISLERIDVEARIREIFVDDDKLYLATDFATLLAVDIEAF